ncbi:MAG: hypothetical protein K0Q66_539 [Chitinophagaceae bacterium]|jgi:hypothetical protein|nr:hypothetical protein [Chitinophagaceae bacterium]
MNERLLQFIWQFQYYNKHQLSTDEGEDLQVLRAGEFNRNQGPDFLNGVVKVGGTTWIGNIELHVKASDWERHRHSEDPNYRNVILHVVWENDLQIGSTATFSLRERVPKVLLERYSQLMQASLGQACRGFLPALESVAWVAWKERLVAERLEQRSQKVYLLLDQANHHWEEVLWWMLAANFGIKVNSEAFEATARSLPLTLMARHKHLLQQVEALLLGQANLLNGTFEDSYPKMLQREYRFLKKKYGLVPHQVMPHFLRMRPANFPTIRLAQLAALLHQSTHLFSRLREIGDTKQLLQLLDVTANDYWHYHYCFDEPTEYKPKKLGRQMAENIIINTIAPLLFAYGGYTGQEIYKDKAISFLQHIPGEDNSITRQWRAAGVENPSAFDSQALVELTHNYCECQRCLECAVGNKVLKDA